MKNKLLEALIGLSFCLMLGKHAIAAIFGATPSVASAVSFLGFGLAVTLSALKRQVVFYSKASCVTVIYITFFAFFFFYAASSTVINGYFRFDLLIELVTFCVLFILAQQVSYSSFLYFLNMTFILSSALALLLITNRGYVFSGGINYLLISLPLGLTTILSSSCAFTARVTVAKLFYLFCAGICFMSLFYLQSRAVFLTSIVLLFFIHCYYNIVRKSYLKLFFLPVLFTFFLYPYFDDFYNLYTSSNLFDRLDAFFNSSSVEPRAGLYSNYFLQLEQFYLSGFGMGGTENGLYSHSVEKYPHNLVLEFWSEFGLMGLILSALILFPALFKSMKDILRHRENIVTLLFFLFFLMNFMKSFSIYQSSMFFLALGFLFNKKLAVSAKLRD